MNQDFSDSAFILQPSSLQRLTAGSGDHCGEHRPWRSRPPEGGTPTAGILGLGGSSAFRRHPNRIDGPPEGGTPTPGIPRFPRDSRLGTMFTAGVARPAPNGGP